MDTDIWSDFFDDSIFGDSFESLSKNIEKMFSRMDNINGPEFKTYGYTIYQGPDGVPHFQEFGNCSGEESPARLLTEVTEPLTDVTLENGLVRAIAEIPGVSKEDILLESTKNSLSLTVNTLNKKFAKTLALPCDVNPDSAKAVYNNGILEVTMDAVEKKPQKKRITIA